MEILLLLHLLVCCENNRPLLLWMTCRSRVCGGADLGWSDVDFYASRVVAVARGSLEPIVKRCAAGKKSFTRDEGYVHSSILARDKHISMWSVLAHKAWSIYVGHFAYPFTKTHSTLGLKCSISFDTVFTGGSMAVCVKVIWLQSLTKLKSGCFFQPRIEDAVEDNVSTVWRFLHNFIYLSIISY